ncbi:hypothetical protein KIN20_022168 [Parelaphostrongylus tenuis]|uniref:Heparan-sulfate 6-O-sulfotransferase n=1 Tax=Parelaphostrongylus tenuis TaxID=148309 RepID=A0AAD5MQ96_PARTN|nr:hypothetical protein KIN20_022168 [Parelaphostrongylus tenuis]
MMARFKRGHVSQCRSVIRKSCPAASVASRQTSDNRVNATLCSRKFIVFLFVILCTPAVYFIIGSTGNQYQYVNYISSTSQFVKLDVLEKQGVSALIANRTSESLQTSSSLYDTSFSRLITNQAKGFSISNHDVLVFVHIQKTAGTSFEKFLVRHLNIEQPCQCIKGRKRCTCLRPNRPNEIWLFSRYSTVDVWIRCSTRKRELNGHEGTSIQHFFENQSLGLSRNIVMCHEAATWIASRHICNGRAPTSDELPLCFDPNIGWDDVSLNEFLHCPFNLAFNRQTRMLADLTLVNCYSRNGMDPKTRDRILLESAKKNLMNMSFFGIKERMEDSQMMFEQLFNISFNRQLSAWSRSKSNDTEVTSRQLKLIRKHNELDVELYDYALKVFDHRLAAVSNRSMSAIKESGGRFTPFEFKSHPTQRNVQFIRHDDARRERIFRKSESMMLSNADYESDDDDDHFLNEDMEVELDWV